MNQLNDKLPGAVDGAVGRAKDAAKGARGAAGSLTQRASRKVAGFTASTAGLVSGASQEILSGTAAVAAQFRQIPSDVLDKIFPECPAPTFILPTGTNPEEYLILFRLEEVFENLKSGIFVRPKIEAWAARDEGWNVDHLAEELSKEFNRQFQESRARLVKSGEIDLQKLESNLQRQSKQMSSNFGEGAASLAKAPIQLGAAGLAFNPLTGAFTWPAGLMFLGLSLQSGANVIDQSSKYFGVRTERGETKRGLRQTEKELKESHGEFDSKDEAFRQAIANLDVKTHPRLQILYRLICEKEGVRFHPAPADTVSAPDIQSCLENSDFLKKLPRRYRKLPELV
jgi:hypothetical protein